MHRSNIASTHDNPNTAALKQADFSVPLIEAARGQRKSGLLHVSVPLRRALARRLSRYRDRIANGGE